ncbi:MAG: ribosome-associated translation inhibitor RaiA [Patescibacteria group bacterium]
MKITISGKNIDITDAINNYIDEKISKLEKYVEGIEPIHAEVEIQARPQGSKGQPTATVEVTFTMPEAIVRVEETAADLYAAVDAIEEKIERKIKKYKERHLRDRKQSQELGVEDIKKVIKRKKFHLGNPITEDEAITRMDLLGHDFYVFVDAITGEQRTVYRRRDGGYGSIEAS